MSDQVTLTIDGREVTVPKGTLVIRAAEQLGIFIPRFCDHPLLEPLGACRQCIVEVEGQRKPMTSCTTPVADGMVVKTQLTSEVAKDAQEGVLELLLINHPLDCPQCDKGGECPLQDQALAYGPGGSRFVEQKRRFTKPVSISPLIKLDRERCVLCARCTRFSDEISGDPFIELLERGALEQVAIYEDEPYRSEFSGNVAQICPVGALTSSTFRFTARPFEMTTTSSTCNRCASGCSILVQERRGQLVRVLSGNDPAGQDEWICDKGRYGYAYAQSPERVTEPLVRKGDGFVAVSWAEALSRVAEAVRGARDAGEPMAAIGGAQLTNEGAYALSRFARVALGTNDVDFRFAPTTGADDAVLAQIAAGAPTAGFADIDEATTVVVAGVDLREVSPIVFLRVRKLARARRLKVVEVSPRRSRLDEVGASWVASVPGAIPAALASLDVDGPVVLLAGDALIGDGSLAACWNTALERGWSFGWVPRKANARGALVAGCAPSVLPGGRHVLDDAGRAEVQKVWNAAPSPKPGRSGAQIVREAADLGVLVVAGCDPVADAPGALGVGAAIDAAGFTVAIDLFLTETASLADVVLPASAAYEQTGTLTAWDGRPRRVAPSVGRPGVASDDWAIFVQLAAELGHSGFPTTFDELRDEMTRLAPHGAERAAVPIVDALDAAPNGLVAVAQPELLDSGWMMHGATGLQAMSPDAVVELHADDAAVAGIGDGETVRLETRHGRTSAPARITDRVARGVVRLPTQQRVLHGIDLVSGAGHTSVKIQRVQA